MSLFSAFGMLPQLAFGASTGPVLRVIGAAAVLALAAHWWRIYRLQRAPWYADALEAAAMLALALALGSMDSVLGIYWVAVYYRAVYGTGRRVIVTAVCYAALLALGEALTRPALGAETFVQIPAVLMTLAVANMLRNSLRRTSALEDELRTSEHRFRTLVENSSDVIMVVGTDGVVHFHTPSARTLLGVETLIGARLDSILHPEDAAGAADYLALAAVEEGVSTEWRLMHAGGMWLHAEVLGNGLFNDAALGGVVLTLRNVTERKALEHRLTHEATHDALTDLPNRVLLQEQMDDALAAARVGGHPLALLFIDLDDFKTVNDTLGHIAGDELIVAVAKRLRGCLRPHDIAARIGGDEFALLLPQLRDTADAEIVASRIIIAFQSPFAISGRSFPVHASVGIAASPDGQTTTAELVRCADVAMYVAKSRGKGRYDIYQDGMSQEIERRGALELEMQDALTRGEFTAYYQPIVDIETGDIVGLEALARWAHPERGIIPPAEFLSVAENTGLIVPIGKVVLRELCRNASAWVNGQDRDDFRVGINLSAHQILNPSVVGDVAAALEESGLEADRLWIEVTETVLQHDVVAVGRRLAELRSLGVHIALDDFGVGYTSLSYLRQFPIEALKIDRSFMMDIDTDPETATVARAIIQLGASLGLRTIAEGIERPEQEAVIRAAGCRLAQGYLYAKPMPAREVTALLRSDRRVSSLPVLAEVA